MPRRYVGILAIALMVFLLSCSPGPATPPSITVTISTPTPIGGPTELPTTSSLPAITAVPAVTSMPAPITTSTPAPAPTIAPTLAPAQAANPPCDSSAFVADVTVRDGTVLATSQAFNKIWRLRNTGTCTWGDGYTLAFVSGTAMASSRAISVAPTAPGRTVDIVVPMTAPSTPGAFTGFWRMRAPGGASFGTTVWVKITAVRLAPVPAPAPSLTPTISPTASATGCSGTPNIASFDISPSTITAGSSATLSWGFVSNADAAIIDNDIGGVATPGSTSVNPTTTTTYTLTANCGSVTQTAQVTLTVTSSGATETATVTPTTATSTPTETRTATPTPTHTRTP